MEFKVKSDKETRTKKEDGLNIGYAYRMQDDEGTIVTVKSEKPFKPLAQAEPGTTVEVDFKCKQTRMAK